MDTGAGQRIWLGSIASCCILALVVAHSQAIQPGPAPAPKSAPRSGADWPVSGGSAENDHYSPLDQINTGNVARIQQAWSFDSGERGRLETTPLMVGGVVYAYTPSLKVIALDAATGKQLWTFDSGIYGRRPSRALTYWQDGKDRRILAGEMNYLYELDAETGKVIPGFGKDGRIDLREGLGREPAQQSVALTSPGVIYKDLIIVGGADPETLPAPPGDIRAYSVRTGEMRWSFHTIPHPGEPGYETWPKQAWTYSGAANNWCGMTVDVERGIVYAPTGSAATDWYGADRVGDDLYANTLLALDAATGKLIWHFQGVRHDLWDRDFPAPPALVNVRRNGVTIPALAQTSKQGFLFVFDRRNGKPLFPIEYRKVDASTVPGEVSAETQPFVTRPAPFARQTITENDLTTRTPEAHAYALERYRQLRNGGPFAPIGTDKETLLFPSTEGGGEWGGPALDPATNILYVNSNDYASTEMLSAEGGSAGRSIYLNQCASCHGQDLAGVPPVVPSLVDIGKKLSAQQIAELLDTGKGRMPPFPALAGRRRDSLLSYLMDVASTDESTAAPATVNSDGYLRFADNEGYPANSFPWGTLNAIDLNTGEYVWKIPFGEYPELVAQGLKNTGSENYGGPLVTRGGLLIIGATIFDNKLRIYDKATGKLLWEKVFPYAINATPMTYEWKGTQYIVVGCGGEGHNPRARGSGGIYYAFALPQ